MSAPKRIALIGHRGVGKTSLLSRIDLYLKEAGRVVRVYDLDQEIARRNGRSIHAIFAEDGEAAFRNIELSTLEELEAEVSKVRDDVVIALGAGFQVDHLKKSWHAIWVRRLSDETGRIFTDRPRLNAETSPLEEFQMRALERTPRYAARSNATLFLDEGAEDTLDPAEAAYFKDEIRDLGGALTVLLENFAQDFKSWAEQRISWGLRWFELRDDLLNLDQMTLAAKTLPQDKILVSYRDEAREASTTELVEKLNLAFDWPAERNRASARTPTYLSLHRRTSSLETTLQSLERLTTPSLNLKAALPVESFRELMIGHAWQMKDPACRVFLPMSKDGRWSWYRLLRGNDISLNFVREGQGSASDQPTLLQWVRRQLISKRADRKKFAAVLGDPVSHSRTPMEQAEFFRGRALGVSAVQVSEREWQDGAVENLMELGLAAAAVTAPLKNLAYTKAKKIDENARELQSVNTLFFGREIDGTNTDLVGLQSAVARHDKEFAGLKTVVWGGGGTLDVLKRVFPRAQFVSVRTQALRENGAAPESPDLVVWAASLRDQQPTPPNSWQPRFVFDLNYSEASPAREYAVKVGARYISGLVMFKAQAQAQREFWMRCEEQT